MELLRDPVWQFVGSLLGLGAIIVSFVLYLKQRQKKVITVENIATFPLISRHKFGIDGLEIRFRGKTVDRAEIFLVEFQNTGNTPILASDYESPLSIDFNTEADLLSADIFDVTPTSLPIGAKCVERSVEISKNLLNPGDRFVCRILTVGNGSKYTVKGRIAGVRIVERNVLSPKADFVVPISSSILAIAAMIMSPEPKSEGISDIRPEEVPYAILLALSVAGMMYLPVSRLISYVKMKFGITHSSR